MADSTVPGVYFTAEAQLPTLVATPVAMARAHSFYAATGSQTGQNSKVTFNVITFHQHCTCVHSHSVSIDLCSSTGGRRCRALSVPGSRPPALDPSVWLTLASTASELRRRHPEAPQPRRPLQTHEQLSANVKRYLARRHRSRLPSRHHRRVSAPSVCTRGVRICSCIVVQA